MNINIFRIHNKYGAYDSHLYVDGKFVCNATENATTQLPAGEYPVTLCKCERYHRNMVCLTPEPPCHQCPNLDFVGLNTPIPLHCPQLKPGNGPRNRHDGSILIGRRNTYGCLIRTRHTFDALYDRIRKALSRRHPVTVIISDNFL